MYRTVKLKFAGEEDLRTFWTRPSKLYSFLGTKILMMAALVGLCVLPKCSAYSITSSLGPSYDFDPFNPSTGRSTRMSWGSEGGSTASVQHIRNSNSGLVHSQSNNNNNYYRDTSYNNNDNIMGPYVRRGGSDSENSQHNNPYTRTQLQVAGRIFFESRVTTPKPLLGFRSYLSSYRNRNYYVKKSKTNHNDFLTNANTKAIPNFYTNLDVNEDEVEQLDSHPSHVRSHNSDSFKSFNVSSTDTGNVNSETSLDAVTTPESKTAPATIVVSPASATERPSSTQQMQSDGPYYSGTLTGSASTHHYQYNNNKGEQFISGLGSDKRPVQITSSPTVSHPHQSLKNNGEESERHYSTDGEKSEDYEDFDSVSHYITEPIRGVEEEPIVFPTTVSPNHRTYKIPTNPWEDSELAGLKNILELRNGGDMVGSFNVTNNNTSTPKGNFSPILEGAKEPDCAKKLGYCDNIDSYPKELLSNVLTNSISSDVFQKVFGDDVASGAHKPNDAPSGASDVVLAGRNGLTQETPLCASQEVTIYPRVARNKEDKWMFIVNHDDYVQGVKVEKCMKEGSSCLFSEGNPLGYESVCRQKFILRKLVALNGEGKTALDTFKLPSCCVCYIKSNYVSERIGSISSGSSSLKSDAGSSSVPSSDSDSTEHDEVNDSPVLCNDNKSSTVNLTSSQTTETIVTSSNITHLNTTSS